MTTSRSLFKPIDLLPGCMPDTDATASDIPCWASTYHVRFDPTTGRLRKLGGWSNISYVYSYSKYGCIRTIFSATINQKVYTAIGTNSYLYASIGSNLYNITPYQTSSVAAAASLATNYATLASNPINTTNGSTVVVVTDTDAAKYLVGDTYTLSGASTTNGVPNTELNAVHIIRSIGTNAITFYVSTSATSTGAGGGASVVRATGLITLTSASHAMANGNKVKVSGAANTGGILAASINMEFAIRNITANTFDFMTNGTATSSVSGGGGAGVVYFKQIVGGNLDQKAGYGYGAGFYGTGRYGINRTSNSGEQYPQIWFCDRFGENIIATPGNSGKCYMWSGSGSSSASLITNAPTDINYAFVSNSILVTFGHTYENNIFANDQGNLTNWTASSTNTVFEDRIDGAGRLISHCQVDGYNLIFTELQTYTMKFIGLPFVWEIKALDLSIGIIAPLARVVVNGDAYWMGQSNFYIYRGGKPEVIGSNFGKQSSVIRYVFDDLNYSQRFKIFAWHNEAFDEIWFHYPSANSIDCNRIVRYSIGLKCWTIDQIDRTAAESPAQNLYYPQLANQTIMYLHESSNNDDGSPMAWSATTKKFVSGKESVLQTQVIPDSEQTGNISLNVRMYKYPQSSVAMTNSSYTITPTTEFIPMQLNGRFWDYTFSGNSLNQEFLMGQWFEEPQQSSRAP